MTANDCLAETMDGCCGQLVKSRSGSGEGCPLGAAQSVRDHGFEEGGNLASQECIDGLFDPTGELAGSKLRKRNGRDLTRARDPTASIMATRPAMSEVLPVPGGGLDQQDRLEVGHRTAPVVFVDQCHVGHSKAY